MDENNRQLERKGGSNRFERVMRSEVRYGDGRPEKDTLAITARRQKTLKETDRQLSEAKAAFGDVRGMAFMVGGGNS